MKIDSTITYTPKLFKNKYTTSRLGKYEKYENQYITLLIELFHKGILDIPENYPMRIFLANCIGRNIMSISKKYTGDKSIGKQRYKFKNISPSINLCIHDFKNIQNQFLKSINSFQNNILIPSIKNKLIDQMLPKVKTEFKLQKKIQIKSDKYSNIEDKLEKIIPFIPQDDFSGLFLDFDL